MGIQRGGIAVVVVDDGNAEAVLQRGAEVEPVPLRLGEVRRALRGDHPVRARRPGRAETDGAHRLPVTPVGASTWSSASMRAPIATSGPSRTRLGLSTSRPPGSARSCRAPSRCWTCRRCRGRRRPMAGPSGAHEPGLYLQRRARTHRGRLWPPPSRGLPISFYALARERARPARRGVRRARCRPVGVRSPSSRSWTCRTGRCSATRPSPAGRMRYDPGSFVPSALPAVQYTSPALLFVPLARELLEDEDFDPFAEGRRHRGGSRGDRLAHLGGDGARDGPSSSAGASTNCAGGASTSPSAEVAPGGAQPADPSPI